MSLSSSLTTTSGFHTSFTTTATITRDILRHRNCSIYIIHDLPPHVFVDPYELAHYENSYTVQHLSGTRNLELPVVAITFPGSSSSSSQLLLNVSLAREVEFGDSNVTISVQVPLHLRYGEPVKSGPSLYHEERIPSPIGYLICPASPSESSAVNSPQPLVDIPMFDSQSVTAGLLQAVGNPEALVRIPLGHLDHLAIVEVGTSCVIIFAFLLILWTSFQTATRLSYHGIHAKSE